MATSDLKSLIEQVLREAQVLTPGETVQIGTALQSITSIPAQSLHQGIWDAIEETKFAQTVLNATSMTEEQLDELAANFLVTRDQGGKSVGSVRLFFADPQAFTVPAGSVFQTESGLRYFAVVTESVTEQGMQLNISGNRFYMDVPTVEAEFAGDEYDAEVGEITSFSGGGSSVVEVRNLVAFSGGRGKETNEELVVRIKESVTVRDLVIRRSIFTVLSQLYPEISSLYSAGYGDPETQLDQKFGVAVGGEVSVYVDSKRSDVFEEIVTVFDDNFEYSATVGGSPWIGQTAFARLNPVIESPIRHSTIYDFDASDPPELDLSTPASGGLALPEPLDNVDSGSVLVIRQSVTNELHTFNVSGQFTVNHPGRRLTGFSMRSESDGTVYFCNVDFIVDPVSGVVTRLDAGVGEPSGVRVDYTWEAILGVDYDVDYETGVITADGTSTLLDAGDRVTVTFSYNRVGARDDTLYTLTNVPIRRVMKVEELDPDENVVQELIFVPPNSGDWDFQTIADSAPTTVPWWTWRVIQYADPAVAETDREYLADEAEVYRHFAGITAVSGFNGPIQAWPSTAGLRYSRFEELELIFVNPVSQYDGSSKMKVTYETLGTVPTVQDRLSNPNARVLCARLLAKCFVPAIVDITFFGVAGATAAAVKEAVENFIFELAPGNDLKVTDIVRVITGTNEGEAGATDVNTPFTLQVTLYYPSGRTQVIASANAINIEKELALIDPDLASAEFVSNKNVKYLPGTIKVNLAT